MALHYQRAKPRLSLGTETSAHERWLYFSFKLSWRRWWLRPFKLFCPRMITFTRWLLSGLGTLKDSPSFVSPVPLKAQNEDSKEHIGYVCSYASVLENYYVISQWGNTISQDPPWNEARHLQRERPFTVWWPSLTCSLRLSWIESWRPNLAVWKSIWQCCMAQDSRQRFGEPVHWHGWRLNCWWWRKEPTENP